MTFTAKAHTSGQARRVAGQVLAGGVGAPIAAGVEIGQWATMEVQTGGARFVQAQPGTFQAWSFDFNNGAFQADLMTNSLHYPVQSWDVVETFVPLSAFDFGFLPGVWYQNEGTSTYSTDLLQGVASPSYSFGFSN